MKSMNNNINQISQNILDTSNLPEKSNNNELLLNITVDSLNQDILNRQKKIEEQKSIINRLRERINDPKNFASHSDIEILKHSVLKEFGNLNEEFSSKNEENKYLTKENQSLKNMIAKKEKIISEFEEVAKRSEAKFKMLNDVNNDLKHKVNKLKNDFENIKCKKEKTITTNERDSKYNNFTYTNDNEENEIYEVNNDSSNLNNFNNFNNNNDFNNFNNFNNNNNDFNNLNNLNNLNNFNDNNSNANNFNHFNNNFNNSSCNSNYFNQFNKDQNNQLDNEGRNIQTAANNYKKFNNINKNKLNPLSSLKNNRETLKYLEDIKNEVNNIEQNYESKLAIKDNYIQSLNEELNKCKECKNDLNCTVDDLKSKVDEENDKLVNQIKNLTKEKDLLFKEKERDAKEIEKLKDLLSKCPYDRCRAFQKDLQSQFNYIISQIEQKQINYLNEIKHLHFMLEEKDKVLKNNKEYYKNCITKLERENLNLKNTMKGLTYNQ